MSRAPIKKSINGSQSRNNLLKRLRTCFFISLALTLLILVPIIGMFPYLLTFPLFLIWDLGQTSELVEFGFMWITIKKAWLWPVFFGYFFTMTLLLNSLLMLILSGFQKISKRISGR